jgi:hypothetical protein
MPDQQCSINQKRQFVMKKLLVLLALLNLSSAQATGFFRSGSDLGALGVTLAPRFHDESASFAKGYVAGVADTTISRTWCPKSQVTEEQINQIVANFIAGHPETQKRNAATIVTEALSTEFPCEKE